MTQFVRGIFFLLTIISLIFALYLLFDYPNLFLRRTIKLFVALWMLLLSYSFFANDYKKAPQVDQSWYKQIQSDFSRKKPSLLVMIGSENYSGQVLTTAGVHPWFCTGKQSDKEGFVFTLRAYERNVFFQSIFDSSLTLAIRKSVADSIKKLGVDCIVGSPSSLLKLQFAQKDFLISPISGTRWFYRIN